MEKLELCPYPWFSAASSLLAQALVNQRLPHALLLAAPKGSGKAEFAGALAKSLLCLNHNGLESGCGQCKACHLFEANSHPDYYLIDCLVDNKGVQKKSIGIDQIRRLNAKLQDTPQLQGWRVAVIASVSAMTTASFNSLLKTLEEPGKNTLIILLAENVQNVPATVRSRCQLLLADLKQQDLLDWLQEQTGEAHETLKIALNFNQSAPLATLEYIKENGVSLQQDLFEQLDGVLENRLTPTEFLNQLAVPLDSLADKLAHYFHQVQLAKLSGQNNEFYASLPAKLPFQLYQKLIEYKRAQHSGSNLQVKLQIEAVLIQWFEIGRKISHYSKA